MRQTVSEMRTNICVHCSREYLLRRWTKCRRKGYSGGPQTLYFKLPKGSSELDLDTWQVCKLCPGNGRPLMADIKSPEDRSRNMAAIRNKDTKPEIYLRNLLFAEGYRYRKNYAKIPGHPDIYLPKYKTAIFVHGCFWHRHQGCKYAYMPKKQCGILE